MKQSGNGAECESDVTSLGTGKELNFDDDTLKIFNIRKWLKSQSC